MTFPSWVMKGLHASPALWQKVGSPDVEGSKICARGAMLPHLASLPNTQAELSWPGCGPSARPQGEQRDPRKTLPFSFYCPSATRETRVGGWQGGLQVSAVIPPFSAPPFGPGSLSSGRVSAGPNLKTPKASSNSSHCQEALGSLCQVPALARLPGLRSLESLWV